MPCYYSKGPLGERDDGTDRLTIIRTKFTCEGNSCKIHGQNILSRPLEENYTSKQEPISSIKLANNESQSSEYSKNMDHCNHMVRDAENIGVFQPTSVFTHRWSPHSIPISAQVSGTVTSFPRLIKSDTCTHFDDPKQVTSLDVCTRSSRRKPSRLGEILLAQQNYEEFDQHIIWEIRRMLRKGDRRKRSEGNHSSSPEENIMYPLGYQSSRINTSLPCFTEPATGDVMMLKDRPRRSKFLCERTEISIWDNPEPDLKLKFKEKEGSESKRQACSLDPDRQAWILNWLDSVEPLVKKAPQLAEEMSTITTNGAKEIIRYSFR
ncbi:hypothetical protein PoB_000706600 [Plakobranchus ocellatus]|uniref:Uncharacterized protein n=1 Tax=Plakobranchus ocellatus TaxID=259542 RepID=A0AAV3YDT8_9GAST|nr:hypothetical protein PoB_000706600 [Plakobranchus ocellatus]